MYRGRKGSPPLGTWLKRLYNQQFRAVFWVANVNRLKNLTRRHRNLQIWPKTRNQSCRKCLRAAGKAFCANPVSPHDRQNYLGIWWYGKSGSSSLHPTRVHLNKNTFYPIYDCYYRVFSRGYAKVFSCHPAAHISLPSPHSPKTVVILA